MDRTRILHFFSQWPWPFPNDLGSKAWHTLMSYAEFECRKNFQRFSIRYELITKFCAIFLSPTLSLPKWLGSSLYYTPMSHSMFVWRKNFQCLSIKKIWTGQYLILSFPASDLDLAQLTLVQGHKTLSWHMQCLCKERTSNASPLKRLSPDTQFALFLPLTLPKGLGSR